MAQLYKLTGKTPAKALAGQAAVIYAVMGGTKGDAPQAKTGKDWTADVVSSGLLKTKQDPYRVVLYYLIGLRKLGLVDRIETAPEADVSEQPVMPEGTDEANALSEFEAAVDAQDADADPGADGRDESDDADEDEDEDADPDAEGEDDTPATEDEPTTAEVL